MNLPIYLDHNATTPLDPRVFQAMTPFFLDAFGNAASRGHSFGFRAMRAVDQARVQVAALLGCDIKEIVWTSGATESNNLAIKGVADMYADVGRHIITQPTEHKAVLDPCKKLSHNGYDLTWLTPDRTGLIDLNELADSIRPDTILVSIMAANNEIGTLQPIREIGRICHERGVIFHCDATQAVGKLPINVESDQIDLLSMSGHKLYGPKGAGILYVRRKNPRVRLTPLFDGGGHEQGFRSGTLNVPGIVGVGSACELAMLEMPQESPRLAALRDHLQAGIMARVDGVTVNGNESHRLPHVTNLSFADVEGEHLLATVTRDLAVSSGSACTSASMEPSFVLKAIGVDNDLAYASIRFSLGKSNDQEQIDFAINTVAECVNRLRHAAVYLSMLVGIILLAMGCSHPDGKANVITQPPAPETVTIDLATDLAPLEAHTVPLLRPTSPNPPDTLLAPLRPLSIDRIPTLVTLGDSVKFDGRFPGDKKDWTKWDQGVDKLVRQNQLAAKPVEYEIWNEPDRAASFKGSQADFFSVWVHTARLIRSIDPLAQLIGPSISKHDYAWTQEFLKIGKEYDIPPTIVCWHENSLKPDLPGHINGVGEAFWQDGTDRFHIRILPSNAIDRRYNPADPVLFLAGLQQAYRETSFRGIDERFGIKLHHLITKDRTPRSIYYAYTAYAELIQRGGHAAKVSSSKTVDGLATWDAPRRTARLLIARNFARAATTQPTPGQAPANQLGPLTLVLKNVRGGTAHVTVSTITDSGDQAFTPSAAIESEVPIAQGQIRLPLSEMASGQVYVMEFKVTGMPATTQASTRPSTQPKP